MEFHVLTPRGPILIFSVDSGRIVPPAPDLGESLASGGTLAATVTAARTKLQDNATDDAKANTSLV